MELQYEEYVRKPYVLRAIQITNENISELAQMIGSLQHKKGGRPFIEVDRQKIPVLTKVFVGYWMTIKGTSIRCYSPRTFRDEFVVNAPEIQLWVDWMNPQDDPAGELDGATQPN